MNLEVIRPRVRRALKDAPEQVVEALENLLEQYRGEQYVYPNVVCQHINCDRDKVLKYLDALVSVGILSQGVELHCYACNRSAGVYMSMSDIQIYHKCPHCEQDMHCNDNLLPIYRVNQE